MLDLYVTGPVIETLPGGKAPKRPSPLSVGFDVFARADVDLCPFIPTRVPLGIRFTQGLVDAMEPWDGSWEDLSCIYHVNELVCELRGIDSLAFEGIEIINSPVSISPDFTEEFCAILRYIPAADHEMIDMRATMATIAAGSRVAQLVFPAGPLTPRLGCEEPSRGEVSDD